MSSSVAPAEALPVTDAISAEDIDFDRRFGGIARLYGALALTRFRQAHVCVIGVGGVGSWAVEALARATLPGADIRIGTDYAGWDRYLTLRRG